MLDRPLAAGFLWGAVTGDWATSLGVAVFFELFWLDLFHVGTYIPPNSLLGVYLVLGVSQYFHLSAPGQILVPLALSLPLALVGARLEAVHRVWQDAGYNALLNWTRRGATRLAVTPGRILVNSLAITLGSQLGLFALGVLAMAAFTHAAQQLPEFSSLKTTVMWGHLWFVAAAGGLLALRIKKSYVVLVVALVLTVVVGATGVLF